MKLSVYSLILQLALLCFVQEVRASCRTDNNQVGHCRPLALCQNVYANDVQSMAQNACPMAGGEGSGVCCPNLVPDPGDTLVKIPATIAKPVSTFPTGGLTIKSKDVNKSGNEARKSIAAREKLEKTLLEKGLIVEPGSTEDLHQNHQFADPEAQRLGKQGLLALEASESLASSFGISLSDRASALPSVAISETTIADACPKEPDCQATKYRSADGSCNNLKQKDWGKSFEPFKRLAQAQYADGIQEPRVATDGTPLPSARVVSSTILADQLKEFPFLSAAFMTFGQFLAHDLSLTPATRGINGTGILCCPPRITPELKHQECFTIDIPENDPFYGKFNQTCMEFVRTLMASPKPECTLGVREQVNQLTSYIDASPIYGSTHTFVDNMRSQIGGKLRVELGSNGLEFPPLLQNNASACRNDVAKGLFCFQSGDVRALEQPQLSTFHVMFHREHNRIANELAILNPGWKDEMLFLETRRIVGAMMQHIVYNEYLPLLLGNQVMKKFNIWLANHGYSDKYDPSMDATILNEFATAAFRFGHSLVPGTVQLIGESGLQDQQLKNHFLTAYDTNLVDDYVRGMAAQGCEKVDDNFTPALTNHLFERGNRRFGLDLASMNIQRGRDHGIPSYTMAREVCSLEKVESFEDLYNYMDPTIADQFSKLYKSVDDIDLWIAGVSEYPLQKSVVGPTFACIIAEQFRRSALGDRLWFERGNTESAFSKAQLIQIRRSTLARVMCDNTEISSMQPLALLKNASWNLQVPCDSVLIPEMDLRAWRNEPIW